MLTRTRRSLAAAAAAGLTLGVLAGCGSDDKLADDSESPSPTPTATPADPASYLQVPEGVTLTEPGTELALGQPGVVAFEVRQKNVAALSVTVTRIERTSFQESFKGWNINDVTAARTPYFVRLKVTNVSDQDLGGRVLDNVIWADDGVTLEAPTYYGAAQLPTCSGALPKAFATNATADLCQVYYIAPGRKLEAIAFEPPAGLERVTWTGPVSKVAKPRAKKGAKKQ